MAKLVFASEVERNDFVKSKMALVEREAWRSFYKYPQAQSLVDVDDLKQEALAALIWCIDYHDTSKHGSFDAFLVRAMQNALINFHDKCARRHLFTYDNPELLDQVPEEAQDAMPTFDDIEILQPLSENALSFLRCVLTPPDELRVVIKAKIDSGKPHSRNILPEVLKWLRLDSSAFMLIKQELVSKCRFTPAC